ncbi:MAG: thiamine pyrophosphokinase [Treponema sp.]|jgi:thiamine pyrophosphokinase|nr:thiamine pyrophosphokinase [Treponema sp.]
MVNRLGAAFIGGGGPAPAYCAELIRDARPRILAAADSGLIAAEKAGLRPDWIIGDMDSLPDPERRLAVYPAGRILRYPQDKDYTDTELVFSLLLEKGCDTVWLIGGGGGRTEHLFAIRSLFERENSPVRWLTAAEDIRRLRAPGEFSLSARNIPVPASAGQGPRIESGFPQAESGLPRAESFFVSVFPLGGGPWKAESSGLKWPLGGLRWERGFFGISNEATGECTITAERGAFMVILSRREF